MISFQKNTHDFSFQQIEDLFCGIDPGRKKGSNKYNELIRFLSSKVEVLTEHVGDSSLEQTGEQSLSDKEIYKGSRMAGISRCRYCRSDKPFLGVGYELGIAENCKPVLCLFDDSDHNRTLSAMISGNHKITTFRYMSLDQAKKKLFPLSTPLPNKLTVNNVIVKKFFIEMTLKTKFQL